MLQNSTKGGVDVQYRKKTTDKLGLWKKVLIQG